MDNKASVQAEITTYVKEGLLVLEFSQPVQQVAFTAESFRGHLQLMLDACEIMERGGAPGWSGETGPDGERLIITPPGYVDPREAEAGADAAVIGVAARAIETVRRPR